MLNTLFHWFQWLKKQSYLGLIKCLLSLSLLVLGQEYPFCCLFGQKVMLIV
ncbi:hypothetical protein RO3G_00802 [Rhizopus delemar RA 99-880]|uniref:Uncharacterized protein n=1 Tax=Rhizopus delemar (strain RA 99-880 / ATCC MYA-4621 / FGSC 9543 / NRRL 43880) TaxID=246409 RepID=I1BIR8_RHIO9|nr:hypothetical protein RO3G_00802 [Rhizopus delemar RA 99-880]|eukprot:EIE76098.1 hypothetical protein RO3G_00802 [Rhizopus delemar RA 99-880]